MERSRRFGLRWFFIVNFVVAAAALSPAHAAREAATFRQLTRASWYGNEFLGKRMAGGKPFDPQKLTAAHPTLNLGTKVKVTDLWSGRSVVVQITDRGPYFPGRGIDLSYAAARALGMVNRGVAQVRVETVRRDERPPVPPIVTAMGGPTLAWLPKAIVM